MVFGDYIVDILEKNFDLVYPNNKNKKQFLRTVLILLAAQATYRQPSYFIYCIRIIRTAIIHNTFVHKT